MGLFYAGRFYLHVCLDTEPDAKELQFFGELFQCVSNDLFDSTEGQHSLAKIFLSYGAEGKPAADVLIGFDATTAAGDARLWLCKDPVMYARDTLPNVTLFVHELSHYLYDVRDEYAGPAADHGLACLAIPADPSAALPDACLMDDRAGKDVSGWYYKNSAGTKYSATVVTKWTDFWPVYGTTTIGFKPGSPSEFCDHSNHNTSAPSTFQEDVQHQSCWETLVLTAKHGGIDYGLIAPAVHPVTTPPTASSPTVNVEEVIPTLRLVLVLDRSGSMAGEKLRQLKVGAEFWIDSVEAPEELAVVSFASTPSLDIPIAEVSADTAVAATWRTASKATVDGLTAGGNTAIGDALRMALDQITAGGLASGQVIVLFTDGIQNAGTELPADVIPDLIAKGVRVHVVGIGADQDPVVLESLAKATCGEYRPIPSGLTDTEIAAQISPIFMEIAAMVHGDAGMIFSEEFSSEDERRESSSLSLQSENTLRIPIRVTEGSRRCVLGAMWLDARRSLSVEVFDPDKNRVTKGAGIRWVQSEQPYAFLVVHRPQPGDWTVRVSGASARDRLRIFGFEERPGLRVVVRATPSRVLPGDTVSLRVRVYAPQPIPGARVRAHLRAPDGRRGTLELREASIRESASTPPTVYVGSFRTESGSGPYEVVVEVEHPGGRVTYDFDTRQLRVLGFPIESAIASVQVPAFTRRVVTVVRATPDAAQDPPFRRGASSKPAWVHPLQDDLLRQWKRRHPNRH